MKTPHKHAELIKAWADGAIIQYKIGNEWVDLIGPVVIGWYETGQYRITPEPKPDYSDSAYGYERRVLDKVMLTFDGETGKLKSAEVIKE
jgi:hypothetical protein